MITRKLMIPFFVTALAAAPLAFAQDTQAESDAAVASETDEQEAEDPAQDPASNDAGPSDAAEDEEEQPVEPEEEDERA